MTITFSKAHHMPVNEALLHSVLPGQTGRDSKVVHFVHMASPAFDVVLAGHGRHVSSP
jgi:hypothetical protein